jgi:Uma2 family endonuclease
MAMPIPLPTYTVDMVRAFPDDGQRYELVEGMLLVTPAPGSAHQVVVARLMHALIGYLEPSGAAYVVSPGEIEIPPTTIHCEPDILVFPSTFRPGTKWTDISGWWLAVEVLSPSSKYYDRDYKLEAYLRVGVREVWMVDLDRRRCEVSDAAGRRSVAEARSLRWHPAGMRQPLVIELDEIFRDVVVEGSSRG